MTTGEFICNCLRLYKGTIHKIDEIVDKFDLDFDEVLSEDVIIESVQKCPRDVGNELIRICYETIIERSTKLHSEIEEEMFDMYLSDYCSSLIFNGVTVHSLEELEEEILKVK